MQDFEDLENRTKTNQRLTILLFCAFTILFVLQWRINANFNQRLDSLDRTGVSHAR